MLTMIDIDELMRRFCDEGADAVRRYVHVSGEDPSTMPEYFMAGFILDHLGSEITATLETNFGYLAQWNNDVRKRRGLVERTDDERSLRLMRRLDGRRVDMVLFEGEEEHKSKDQQDFFALVEFKRGWISASRIPGQESDRDKLLLMLEHIDTCPWGIVCAWVLEDNLEWQKNESIKGTNDRWYEKKIDSSDGTTPGFFCARVFARSSDENRLRELLSA
jgi:hypothetical protein